MRYLNTLASIPLGLMMAMNLHAQTNNSSAVTIPELKKGLEVTIEGLYLQSNQNDLVYATINPASANASVKSLVPGYNFGFRVGMGYMFSNSGNDVQASWTHISNQTSDTLTAEKGQTLAIPGINTKNVYNIITQINGNYKLNYNAVDVNIGQYVNVGNRLQLRLFGGLRYASLDSSMSSVSPINYNTKIFNYVVGNISSIQESSFKGIGPSIGLDSNFDVGHHFGISTHVAGSLLVGKKTSKFDEAANIHFADVPKGPMVNGDISSSTTNKMRVVPAVDAKLGLNYSFAFSETSVLTVEAGYQVSHYFGAFDTLSPETTVNLTKQSFTLQNINSGHSDVNMAGPYLSLNLKI